MKRTKPYYVSLNSYERLKTRIVHIGDLKMGGGHRIKIQTMTTTDSMDTENTVSQAIRCIEAGSELVRITAPSKKEAKNLYAIKKKLRAQGYKTPLVADIHYTPNAAEIAAQIVEKVRINPGNYIDKKKFKFIEYSDASYKEELEKIYVRFRTLLNICKKNGTALRIGTNHGSLSDRIMNRYGDTPNGMVESAMEFIRMARKENFHEIVMSMKSSNTQVMVQAYRLLVKTMQEEFDECYPLHLGITEAGDGEDGRIKSAIGIGALLEDGIGDTIRVSLTEGPELELPVCELLRNQYPTANSSIKIPPIEKINYNVFSYNKNSTNLVSDIGDKQVPIVITDMSKQKELSLSSLSEIGFAYDPVLGKWKLSDRTPDYIYVGTHIPQINFPTTLKFIVDAPIWQNLTPASPLDNCIPIFDFEQYKTTKMRHPFLNFVMLDCFSTNSYLPSFSPLEKDKTIVYCLHTTHPNYSQSLRRMCVHLKAQNVNQPIIFISNSNATDTEKMTVLHASKLGHLFLDGWGDGICLRTMPNAHKEISKQSTESVEKTLNSFSFGILQGTRTRFSKTEYISCPSCGRTLFDLQSTTQKVRSATSHLKGLKIAIMGCIVNGPGEMADADFGYVGSGVGKITLYKGKEIIKRNIDSEVAVDELIGVIQDNACWIDPS